jgi:hypothetical protein
MGGARNGNEDQRFPGSDPAVGKAVKETQVFLEKPPVDLSIVFSPFQ